MRFRDVIADAPLRPMAEVAPAIRRTVDIDISQSYREVGARSFGKGLFVKPDFDGAEATWQKPVWIKSGDLVLSNIKAWEGAIAVASEVHDGCIASHRYITCVPDLTLITAGFLAYYLLSEDGLEKVGFASPGTADRNRTLSLGNLGKIEVPLSILILFFLFWMQSHGTERVSKLFGPITVVWFFALAVGGLIHIADDPSVLTAINPIYGVSFLVSNGLVGLTVLGLVFLSVTGAEALPVPERMFDVWIFPSVFFYRPGH